MANISKYTVVAIGCGRKDSCDMITFLKSVLFFFKNLISKIKFNIFKINMQKCM